MIALLIDPIYWNWLILCGLFLLMEIFTVSFFFLIWATTALIMAAITFAFPEMSWQMQLLLFSVLSLVGVVLWWFFARHWRRSPNSTADKLNNRGRYLIGRQYVLQTPIHQGYGRLQIDDSLWTVQCDEELPAGTKVVIKDIDSLTLKVARVG
ncbi:NfeD family protein [Suttonella sp. R2A3]|uniref:NfeD family protein n=1 Tax=Suttonella sp. R2A3 TaxID=2908648 RepID=UPI001F4106A9|nr:NfeD family protein [Suttonella sp. R2A3]UJF23828.1 NfeD family protein [Suttonella sp. R2A3]